MASVNKWIGIDLYVAGKSIPQVSQETGVTLSTTRLRLFKAGVLRGRGDAIRLAASQGRWSHGKGERREISDAHRASLAKANKSRNRDYCAGVSVKPNGYVEITRGKHKGRGMHVVVMEEKIGRKLLPNEVVHHIDRDRGNNPVCNLMLMTRSEHARLHAQENHEFRDREKNGRFC